MDVVEKWCHVLLAQAVITATSNHNCRINGQVGHGVAEPRAGRLTIGLNWNKFTLNHFAVNCYGLEVSKFVHKLSITLLTTEVVNAILDCITLSLLELVL